MIIRGDYLGNLSIKFQTEKIEFLAHMFSFFCKQWLIAYKIDREKSISAVFHFFADGVNFDRLKVVYCAIFSQMPLRNVLRYNDTDKAYNI